MADSDDLYDGMGLGDGLITALGTNILAERDMVPTGSLITLLLLHQQMRCR